MDIHKGRRKTLKWKTLKSHLVLKATLRTGIQMKN